MTEYIKREDVLALSHYDDHDCEIVDVEDVEKLPSADVRPVVRGIWEKQDAKTLVWNDVGLYVATYKCNRCDELSAAETNYCPNCGAMMEES